MDTGPNNFSVTANGGGTWVSDRFLQPNSAFAVNGINQNLVVPYDARLYPTEFTLCTWVNFQQVGEDSGTILASGNNTSDGWRGFTLYFIGPNLAYQDYNGSWYNTYITVPTNNFQVGTWYQFVIARTTNSCTLFVNGAPLASQTGLTPYTKPQLTPISFGANVIDPNDFFLFVPVTFDTIHIYNRALATNEVAQLYAAESAGFSQSFLNLGLTLNLAKQSTNNVMGVVATTASPTYVSLNTKDILAALAFDEHAEGNWPGNNFPTNSTLALVGNGLVVRNGTNVILNVSDIMSFNTGEPKVISGRQNTVTGLAFPKVNTLQVAGIMFDDTFIKGGNNFKFYLNGFLSKTIADTTPVNGAYTEIQTISIKTASGDGTDQNVPFMCSGSVSATGKSSRHL